MPPGFPWAWTVAASGGRSLEVCSSTTQDSRQREGSPRGVTSTSGPLADASSRSGLRAEKSYCFVQCTQGICAFDATELKHAFDVAILDSESDWRLRSVVP